MCKTDQPEPSSQLIAEPQPNAEENPEETEISLQETIDQIALNVEEFSDWAGFDDYHKKTAHLLLLGFLIEDLQQACELVGCTEEFAERIIKRIHDNGLSKDPERWYGEKEGNITFMLDVMVATGILKRKSENGNEDYQEADPAALTIGVHVRHKSGFGSGWWIAAHKTGEDGQQFVRLKKSCVAPGRGGKWRAADNYVRSHSKDHLS